MRSSLCPFGLMSVRATVLLGVCLVGLMSIKLLSMGRCPVRLLSSLVTVLLGYCLSGKCPSGYCLSGMCPRGCVLGEVYIRLVPGWPTVRIPCKKGVLKNFAIFTGKNLCWSPFAGLQGFNFINKRHQQLCFPANIAEL